MSEPKTVRVRIAVAWDIVEQSPVAYGCSKVAVVRHDYAHPAAMLCDWGYEDAQAPGCWVEVDVPLPSIPTVEGEVTSADQE